VDAYAASLLTGTTTALAAGNTSGLNTPQAIGIFAGIPLGLIVLIGLTVFTWTRGKSDGRSARVSSGPRVRTTPVLGRPVGSENDPGPQRTPREVPGATAAARPETDRRRGP
jgi:hypothetical protein